MKRTNLVLHEDVLEEATRLSGGEDADDVCEITLHAG
jgi:hypothetical protein